MVSRSWPLNWARVFAQANVHQAIAGHARHGIRRVVLWGELQAAG